MLSIALMLLIPPGCEAPASATAQMALSYDQFDTRAGEDGWRSLNGRGCTDTALALLQRYADANQARLSPAQRHEIAFHAGQALAMAGRNAEAIPHLERADGADADPAWRAYVAATLAFLRRDAAGLAAARTALASHAPGSSRLSFVDGFIACPTTSYMQAAHCALPARPPASR